jgi:DNA-binding XRE family transcriptional regulator
VPDTATQSDPLERKTVFLLKAERERQQLSAAQLAAKIGISRAAITHIEADRSRPTFWIMLKIAGGLGLKLENVVSEARKTEKP